MNCKDPARRMIGLALIALVVVGCSRAGVRDEAVQTATNNSAAVATATSTDTPVPQCPVTCSADLEAWGVDFRCEAGGQTLETTTDQDFVTTFVDGEPHVSGEMDFKYTASGNTYHIVVEVEPCEESSTGYCISVEATGDTLGDEPVHCQNY